MGRLSPRRLANADIRRQEGGESMEEGGSISGGVRIAH